MLCFTFIARDPAFWQFQGDNPGLFMKGHAGIPRVPQGDIIRLKFPGKCIKITGTIKMPALYSLPMV